MSEAETKPWVIEATAENFEEVTSGLSHKMPVVIDFWAPWCQPCQMLAPLLEEKAKASDGKFTLVKVNVDELGEQSAPFGISSIPAVFAMVGGQLVDHFMGLPPEDQLDEWLGRLGLQQSLMAAIELEDTDPEAARKAYESVLKEQPGLEPAQLGVARCALASGDSDAATAILQSLEEEGPLSPEAEKVKAKLELGSHRADDLVELRAAVDANPSDLPAKKALADALAARGEFEAAMDLCLELIEIDTKGIGDDARKLMLDVFKLLPEGSEIVTEYRRRLTTLLF